MPAMATDYTDYREYTDLVHALSGVLVRYRIKHPGPAAGLEFQPYDRFEDVPTNAVRVRAASGDAITFIESEWHGRHDRAAAQLADWLARPR